MARPRVLLLAMYDLRDDRSGPTVRIGHMRRALEARADVAVLAGSRGARRRATWRFLLSGALRRVDAIYVESSTALPSETDLALLSLARLLGRRVITYVRDAYQLFPDWYPVDAPKRWLSRRLFPFAMRALEAVSSKLAFPTRGLADAVLGPGRAALLLPPGAPPPCIGQADPGARDLLFVGNLRTPPEGGDLLLAAVALARQRGCDVGLIAVTRPGDEPAGALPPWLHLERAASHQIPDLLAAVVATVIPRPPGAYADLALPIKLMEYLSYGRPLLVTSRRETARVVRDAAAGIVADDGVEALADGIATIIAAPGSTRAAWGAAAAAAALEHGWGRLADDLLTELAP